MKLFPLQLLSNPMVFNLQQKLCNDYKNVAIEFSDYLSQPSSKILDLGCSTGIAGQEICDMHKLNYVGIDVVPKYIQLAKKNYPTVDYRVMDGRKLLFETHSFDLILFLGVLHHMDDDIAAACLKEVRRILKPTGHLLIAEPVFTPNRLMSNIFLSLDRGKFIRESSAYIDLAHEFTIVRHRYFHLSLHRFLSIIAR